MKATTKVFLAILFLVSINLNSQTSLSAGEIAITGFTTDNPDHFVFVLLKDIESGTQINFTDRGWNSSTGAFRVGEGTLTWTATTNFPAGTVIDVLDLENPFISDFGTITDDSSFQLSATGDQILVYQGTDSNPTFLNVINMDNSGWSNAIGTESTALPPGLTDGINALNFDEIDNGSFICPSTPVNGSPETLLTSIMNASNWELSNGILTTTPLGGGCIYNILQELTPTMMV